VRALQPLERGLRRDQGRPLTDPDLPIRSHPLVTGTAVEPPVVEFDRVVRQYGAVRAVDGLSFAIAKGEFFAMLGPSGSGKTTSLRLIAGFERPDAGRVLLHGQDVAATPPHQRDVNTVFQDYALFPHLSVIDNVSYGLRMRGVPASTARTRAISFLDRVQLRGYEERAPSELSGGQRQRVALARALINEPSVLLLDEPLGALDLKLREEMQTELKVLQRAVGITFIFVTHDQGEALSMADRVAVFNAGRIEQLDTPRVLYEAPATEFVARFVGSANIIKDALAARLLRRPGCFAIRAEDIEIDRASNTGPADGNGCVGTVIDVQFRGSASRVRVDVGDGAVMHVELTGGSTDRPAPMIGDAVALSWPQRALVPLRDPA
jgi:putative spermidine/putrescine transport system ATP-binding protein